MASSMWECRFCATWMGWNVVKCYGCRTRWQDCQVRRSKSAGREKSKEQQGGARKRSALSPFGGKENESAPAKTPWVNTTPQTRVQARVPLPEQDKVDKQEKQNKEGSNAAASSATPYTEGQIKDQLSMLIRNAGTTLAPEMKDALEKLTTPTNTPEEGLRHSHVYKVENSRRSLVKLREKITEADRDWRNFESILTKKYEAQKTAFLTTRQELLGAYKARLEQYNQAVEELKLRAGAEKTHTTGNLEHVNMEPPAWASNLLGLPDLPDMIEIDTPDDGRSTTPPQKQRKVGDDPNKDGEK